jgi:molecular chaperone HtpG
MSDQSQSGSFPVRVDFEQILQTIAARIYDNQYAFLRENVQNAIDAVRMQARRDRREPGDPLYRIDIQVAGPSCTISDNGIGMTREELINNFWTMGASGKNTPEARAAGCIGTFGIGGFANFGVCDTLEVTSRTSNCSSAHRTSLSRAAFKNERFALPEVAYTVTEDLPSRGTVVRGVASMDFDSKGLLDYVRQFVRHVQEAVFFDGQRISQIQFDPIGATKRVLGGSQTQGGVTFQLFADPDSNLSAQIASAEVQGTEISCKGQVRLVHGAVDVYKRGFKLCSTTIASRIGVSGWIDSDAVRPTAGRDSLDNQSQAYLTDLFRTVETTASQFILEDSELLAGHVRLLPDYIQRGLLEKLSLLKVDLIGGGQMTLGEIREAPREVRKVFFSQASQRNATTDVLATRGHILVRLSGNSQRRSAELAYLRTFCGAQELDTLIECLEPYGNLDAFERGMLSEIDLAIRKLFRPPDFHLVPGKLTFDTPIYWSGKKEAGAVVVFVDTRHDEIQKLRPLGYSPIFWSMVEIFCREYLGDTLKRQSPKFFGSGAIDLDAFSKAEKELWELVVGDIEVSRVGMRDVGGGHSASRVEVVGRGDITKVTISSGSAGGVTTPAPEGAPGHRKAPKLLHIVDETGRVGVGGFYLRIPESATAAFGEIIRTFPSFAVVWFANRVTWQGTDLSSTAFLFDVTLDRLVADASGMLAHGSTELSSVQVQSYEGQIFFLIPPQLEDRIVPRKPEDLIKLEIRHELVDLNRARSWTARQPKAQPP